MKRFQIYLTGRQLFLLNQLKIQTGKSRSALIREALDDYLDRQSNLNKNTFSWRDFAEKHATNLGSLDIDKELYGW